MSNTAEPQPSKLVFVTPAGIKVPAVTAVQMKELDSVAERVGAITVAQMNENDGRTLVELVMEVLKLDQKTHAEQLQLKSSDSLIGEIVVLCGKGGNGAGGICSARHLANRGIPYQITVCFSAPDALDSQCQQQRKVYQGTTGREVEVKQLSQTKPTLILDCLLGYNVIGAPREPMATMIKWANDTGAPIIALDLPSGMDATTGAAPGACIKATHTLTLGLPKSGLLNCGKLYLGDIGAPLSAFKVDSLKLCVPYQAPFGAKSYVPLSLEQQASDVKETDKSKINDGPVQLKVEVTAFGNQTTHTIKCTRTTTIGQLRKQLTELKIQAAGDLIIADLFATPIKPDKADVMTIAEVYERAILERTKLAHNPLLGYDFVIRQPTQGIVVGQQVGVSMTLL